jgi:hypothetical protein
MSRAKRKRKAAAARKQSKRRVHAVVDLITSDPVMDLVQTFLYKEVRRRVQV